MLSIVLGIAHASAASPTLVHFPSLDEAFSRGQTTKLDGYLYRPTTDKETRVPAVVLAHGCSGMLDDKGRIRAGITQWAEHFTAKGWIVLAVDSFNPRGHREVCTQSSRPILESRERPRDAYGALQYLATLPVIDPEKIFLMGFSNGATGALYAVEKRGKPLALADAANVKFRAAMAFYPGCSAANKARLLPAIPLAIFIGADDDWTPARPCIELVQAAKNRGSDAVIFQYSGAYHGFDVPGSKVRVRKDVRMSNRPGLAAGVHVGGNETARLAAIVDVDVYLARQIDLIKISATPPTKVDARIAE